MITVDSMKIYKNISVLIIALITSVNIWAMPTVSEADSAYMAGDYLLAANIYREVAQEHGVSAALLYNMGNAFMQEGDYGNAMLSYRKAKKLDPSNKLIQTNLDYLAGKVEDANKAEQKGKRKKVTVDNPNFFQTVHASVAQNTSSNNWAIWAAGAFLLFSGCVVLYLYNSNVLMRKTGFFGGIILLGISMVCLICAYSAAAEAENHDFGVIMAFKTELQTEPVKGASKENAEGVLTRGTTVRIISEETDADGMVSWYKVRLNSDYIGWIPAKDLEII